MVKILFLTTAIAIGQVCAENKFAIVITSFNNKTWYKQNLDSVFMQEYPHFRAIYIDDNSPDGTGDLVEQYIALKGQAHKVTLIKNKNWQGQMANHFKAVHMCDDKEIVVHLDGDDWLAHKNVLNYLDGVYKDPNVWLTYGQCRIWPGGADNTCKPIPAGAIENNNFRQDIWMYGHLRSFYAGLFKRLKLQDLLFEGTFKGMSPGPDIAFMIPMLEMAGKHVRFISDILYIWNHTNPISQHNINPVGMHTVFLTVRSWPRYQPLAKLSKDAPKESSYDVLFFTKQNCKNCHAAIKSVVKNLPDVHLVYVVTDADADTLRSDLKSIANKTRVIKYPFKSVQRLTSLLKPYVFLTNEDYTLTGPILVKSCIQELERTSAFGFYLGEQKSENNAPKMTPLSPQIYALQFKYALDEPANPLSLNMALYRSADISMLLHLIKGKNLNEFQKQWYDLKTKIMNNDDRQVGLFFNRKVTVTRSNRQFQSRYGCD